MVRYERHSSASPAAAWALYARPDRWHEWAPHLRGAWGLGTPEVREGARGAARLLGIVPVPAKILRVDPGRSWTWKVGPAEFDHTVDPDGHGGSVIGLVFRAPAPLEQAFPATYGPICSALITRLADRAKR